MEVLFGWTSSLYTIDVTSHRAGSHLQSVILREVSFTKFFCDLTVWFVQAEALCTVMTPSGLLSDQDTHAR